MSDGFRAKILNLLYQIKLAIRAIQKGGFYIQKLSESLHPKHKSIISSKSNGSSEN